jgi:hypothetical protein
VAPDAVLSWRPGREAVAHEVYLSSDRQAVADGAALVRIVTEPSLDLAPLALEYGKTYYWKVTEIGDTATPGVWEGDVWTFSTGQEPDGGL